MKRHLSSPGLTRARLVGTAVILLLSSTFGVAAPAAAGQARLTQMMPTTFVTTEDTCVGAGVALCHSAGSPGTYENPTMTIAASLYDPVDPAPTEASGFQTVRHTQVARQTFTKAASSVTYKWSFRVDANLIGKLNGTLGTKNWTLDLSVRPYLDDCPDHPYGQQQLFHLNPGDTVTKGTTYSASFTYGPCSGATSIPAGTHTTLTAELLQTANAGNDLNPWNGSVDLTGAVTTTSVTSTAS